MPPTDNDADAADELRDAAASLRRLANGENLEQVYPEFTPHNVIGALCLDRGTLAHAWIAEHPADDSLPIDAAWIDVVGGDDERGCGVVVWPVGALSKLCVGQYRGTGAWHCWVRDGDGDGEETVTLPQLTTRGQLRRLLAALGVTVPAEGGAACRE